MGLSDHKLFSSDTLRIEMSGPEQPHLTPVDLPGLFRAGSTSQSSEGAPIVMKMVRKYMAMPRSVILAVVSAQVDLNLQVITEVARELDPHGKRTLGLITKPDTLPEGSDSESRFINLARNKEIVFDLGWHVVRNRKFETRDITSEERDAQEKEFLDTGVWGRIPRDRVGVKSLCIRLSDILMNLILRTLPDMLGDVLRGIDECRDIQKQLGDARSTVDEQRRYLRQVSWHFSRLMEDAVYGRYSDPFFGPARTPLGFEKRLRAVVQNELEIFREDMRYSGRKQIIVEKGSDIDALLTGDHVGDNDGIGHGLAKLRFNPSSTRIKRKTFLYHVSNLSLRSRGCELPGTFNPMIIAELFQEQCQPWSAIAGTAAQKILQATRKTVRHVLEDSVVSELFDKLLFRLDDEIDMLEENTTSMIRDLLESHLQRQPITCNHYLTDTVQKIQEKRKFLHGVEPDMAIFASQLATDYMQAYYKVSEALEFGEATANGRQLALKRFIDDLADLAVEVQLMRHLPLLFTSDAVDKLDDQKVIDLAAEAESTIAAREHNESKLQALESARLELEKFRSHYRLHLDNGDSDDTSETNEYKPSSTVETEQRAHETLQPAMTPSTSDVEPELVNEVDERSSAFIFTGGSKKKKHPAVAKYAGDQKFDFGA